MARRCLRVAAVGSRTGRSAQGEPVGWRACAGALGPGAARAPGPSGRWRRRSVLRTDFPARLASGSCGATRFARCARFAQTQRRKSEVRSALRAPTPRLRCSAPPKSPREARRACGPGPERPGAGAPPDRFALGAAPRPAADGRSGSVGGVPCVVGAVAHEHHDGVDKGAGRAPRARLVRSREAQRHRRRAQRASSIILVATVRAELAQRVSPRQPVMPVQCARLCGACGPADLPGWQGANRSHAGWHGEDSQRCHPGKGAAHKRRIGGHTALTSQGTPAKRGQAPGAPAAHGPRLCAQSQNAPSALEPLT